MARGSVILAAFLFGCLCDSSLMTSIASRFRVRSHTKHFNHGHLLLGSRWITNGPFDSIVDSIQDAAEDATGTVKEAADAVQETAKSLDRASMGAIDVMRASMCLQRPDLLTHKRCLKYLVKVCVVSRTGDGTCKKFSNTMKDACAKGESSASKSGTCEMCEKLAKVFGGACTGGDSAVADSDGDGHPDDEDMFPNDPKEWHDQDGDGSGDNADAFPADPSKWRATEHVHQRANTQSDPDEGDGIPNAEDAAIEQIDPDNDGDGIVNSKDAFPEDPNDWKDSDGDGVGDNSDSYPFNANCHDKKKPCEDSSHAKPWGLNKKERPLPAQGYDEHSEGPDVEHDDLQTYTSDWATEWPTADESEQESVRRICSKFPDTSWCKGHLREYGPPESHSEATANFLRHIDF